MPAPRPKRAAIESLYAHPDSLSDLIADHPWMKSAACKGDGRFTADQITLEDHLELAQICMSCPVLSDCRAYTNQIEPTHGIWAAEKRQRPDLETVRYSRVAKPETYVARRPRKAVSDTEQMIDEFCIDFERDWPDEPLTVAMILKGLAAIHHRAFSMGQIGNTLVRWHKIGYADIAFDRPTRFLGRTQLGRELGTLAAFKQYRAHESVRFTG